MVGSRKHKKDSWMPSRVYRGKSSYEYRPAGGGCIKLVKRPRDGIESEQIKADVWAAYKDAITVSEYCISDLIRDFHASPQFARKSKRTKEDYERYSVKVGEVFGEMRPENVMPVHIRRFMDRMGTLHPVTANRHHSYLSVLLGWGLERGLCQDNAAKKVKKFPEEPRDRYPEDWEYNLVRSIAKKSGYPYVSPLMEIGYLCRARPHCEARLLTEFHISEDGIFLERTKGSINEITGWSDRLRAAVEEARSLYPKAPVDLARPLVHNRQGKFIPESTVKTAWTRIMTEALKQGLKNRFTMQDIKAKGVTDHDKKNQGASGHRTKKMLKVYDRKPGIMEPTR